MSTKSKYVEVKTSTSLQRLVEQRIQSKREHEKKQRIKEPHDIGLIFLTPVKKGSSPPKNVFSVESKSMPVHGWPLFIDSPPSFHINFMEIKDRKSMIKEYNTTCTGEIKATCNGLIVLENHFKRGGGLILLNPVTKEVKNISLGTISSKKIESYGLAFCHVSRKYKLVHLFKDDSNYIGCEIMDIESGSWREVDGPPKGYFHSLRNPVFAMRALHWLPIVDRNEYMVSMPLDDENFKKIPFPRIGRISNGIFEMDGFLGCVTLQEVNGVDVWILRSLGGERWEKQYSIDVNEMRSMVPLYYGRVNGELVFKGGDHDGNIYAYDRHSRLVRKIEMVEEWHGFGGCCCFPHVNSLVSWRSRAKEEW